MLHKLPDEKTLRLLNAPFWILPSGRAIAWKSLLFVERFNAAADAPLVLSLSTPEHRWVGDLGERTLSRFHVGDPHDIAALQSALLRVGEPIEAATLAGDDADGRPET